MRQRDMARSFGARARRRAKIAALCLIVIVGASAGGRELLRSADGASGGGATGSASAGPTRSPVAKSASGQYAAASSSPPSTHAGSSSASSSSPTGTASSAAASSSQIPGASTVEPVGPDVVHTATVSLEVSKGSLGAQMSKIADLAGADGGYVDSSSLSGGTARTAPLTGSIVVRVPDSDFSQVLSQLGAFGKVRAEQESGQDVTGQVAENAATLQVLQEEVNLLQSKLSQATDIDTFLQIEGQLAPVQQQLQQLQSQQDVLENSVALATVTVNLAAPGSPAPASGPKPQTNAARTAWRYATHNTLVVLDGLAVAAGWALPLLVLGGLGWLVVTRLRRRRPGVTTA